jgi:hypothetical protein
MNSFLMEQALRAMLLLIAAYLVTFAMRRASASARRLVWIAAAACLLAMPVLSLLLPRIGNGPVAAAPAAVVMRVSPARTLWRYQPMLLNGQPVEAIMTITVDFRLTP